MKGNTRHGSYYINVGQVLGVIGGFILGWRAIDKLGENGSKIEIDGKTVENIADEVGRTIRYKSF